MRIDYCPKCKKAGLQYNRIYIPIGYTVTPEQLVAKEEGIANLIKGNKWCPRCKEWVKPVSKEACRC